MRRFLVTALALVAGYVSAGEPHVPKESQGYWVPASASCVSDLGVFIGASSVEFRNKQQRRLIKTQACFSCEGGARYSGIVIWVTADVPGSGEFTVYLNSEERQGMAKVEIDDTAMRSAFPLDGIALKRCEI